MGLESGLTPPADAVDPVKYLAVAELNPHIEISTDSPMAHLRSIVTALATYQGYESAIHYGEKLPDGTIKATIMEVAGGLEYGEQGEWSNDYSRITVTPDGAMIVQTLSVEAGTPLAAENIKHAQSVEFDPESKEGIEELERFVFRLTPALIEAEGRLSNPEYREFGSAGEIRFKFAKQVDDKFPGILKEYPSMHLRAIPDIQSLIKLLADNGINLIGKERLWLKIMENARVAKKFSISRDHSGFHIRII